MRFELIRETVQSPLQNPGRGSIPATASKVFAEVSGRMPIE